MKPGITGMAQENGRGRLSFEETVAWDVKYGSQRSRMDIKILARTLFVIVTRHGAF